MNVSRFDIPLINGLNSAPLYVSHIIIGLSTEFLLVYGKSQADRLWDTILVLNAIFSSSLNFSYCLASCNLVSQVWISRGDLECGAIIPENGLIQWLSSMMSLVEPGARFALQ